MEKLQSGLVIEFYSNSCLVRTANEDIKCLAIKNIVVGDIVNLELEYKIAKKPRVLLFQKSQEHLFFKKERASNLKLLQQISPM